MKAKVMEQTKLSNENKNETEKNQHGKTRVMRVKKN
jgi:hypothetical protein